MPGKRKALKKLLKSPPPPPVYTYEEGVALEDLVDLSEGEGEDASSAPTSSTPATSGGLSATPASAAPAPSASPVSLPPSTTSAPGAATPESESDGGFMKGGKKKSSKQRFAERQARKQQAMLDTAPPSDPAWNEQLERERQEEIQVISDACNVLGREIYEIQPDGHCMFSAVADQLGQMGMLPAHQANNPYHTRRVAANYMREHKDDFLPFLASVDGEDMPGATDDGIMTDGQFNEYCHRVEGTAEWGGEPEIQALSRAFNIPIHVFQRGPPTVVSHGGADDTFGGATDAKTSAAMGDGVVRITYHRRMYGLGEHYNSLRLVK